MGRHFKSFSYNFETYSVKDIVRLLLLEGFRVTFYSSRHIDYLNAREIRVDWNAPVKRHGFHVEDWPMIIRPPLIKDVLESNFGRMYSLSASVLWMSHERIYYPISGKRDENLVKQHDKVFSKLKRKFAMSKERELPKAIKDLEWLQRVEKLKHPVEIKTVEELEKLG